MKLHLTQLAVASAIAVQARASVVDADSGERNCPTITTSPDFHFQKYPHTRNSTVRYVLNLNARKALHICSLFNE